MKEDLESLLERAVDKSNVGTCFTSDMTTEDVKKALKLAREKAKKVKYEYEEVNGE